MSKQTGLGDNLYIGGFDASGDVGSLGRVGGGPAPLEVTAIDKEAFERIAGLFSASVEHTAYFNPAPDQAHERLGALPRGDQIVTYCRGTALGSPAACLVAKQLNYDGTRGADGAFTFETEAQSTGGIPLEWGVLLTPGKRADTEATDGDSLDGGAATEFGLAAYLHVFELDGDDLTVTIEESSDDGSSDAFAAVTGGAFTQVTAAPAAERIVTAADQTVERYLRVSTTGTFTTATFAVVVVRFETAREY